MINTNKEAGESSFISTFSLLKESIIQSIEKRSLSASLIQKVAIGAFATITMGFLSYQSIKYFYSTFQNREFEKILQSWLRDGQATGNKQEAYKKIKEAFDQKSTYLDLSSLGLNTLPPVFSFLQFLQELHLDRQQFTVIPKEIYHLEQLEILYLGDNQITDIPAKIGNLKKLRKLYLSGNQITDIPAEIGDLKRLQKLYLSRNKITDISTKIGDLTQLEILDLNNNQITHIPDEIKKLTRLNTLVITHNASLDKLPLSPEQLSKIKGLSVDGTKIDPSMVCSSQ